MARSLKIRKPNSAEMRRLQAVVEETSNQRQRHQAEVLLFYAADLSGTEIAAILGMHVNTVYAALHAFDQGGLNSLKLVKRGAPPRLTPAQRAEIVNLAEKEPAEFGLPYARWSLAKYQDFLIHRRRLLKYISREHLRRLLDQADVHFRRVQRKLISHDPRRRAILARIKYVFKHLPADGQLILFDVQPISVKAYGGRRFSSKPLMLERYQKTRGRFYLFALYDVKHGRVRWRFYPSKNSHYVCLFMKQVRRWHPTQEIWMVLDQDPAHPRKSHETR